MDYQSDKALARSVCQGNRKSLQQFFDLYFPKLYRFCVNRLNGDEEMAKDIVQQSMCKAVRKLSTYRGEAALLTWLIQICRSELSAFFRLSHQKQTMLRIDDQPEVRSILESISTSENDEPEQQEARAQLQQLIRATLDYLPGRYGDILEWKYIENLSVNEIATRLGASFESAQSSLARARRAFRNAVGDLLSLHGLEDLQPRGRGANSTTGSR